jgi:hypothetical protein
MFLIHAINLQAKISQWLQSSNFLGKSSKLYRFLSALKKVTTWKKKLPVFSKILTIMISLRRFKKRKNSGKNINN